MHTRQHHFTGRCQSAIVARVVAGSRKQLLSPKSNGIVWMRRLSLDPTGDGYVELPEDDDRFFVGFDASLYIAHIVSEDAGLYSCFQHDVEQTTYVLAIESQEHKKRVTLRRKQMGKWGRIRKKNLEEVQERIFDKLNNIPHDGFDGHLVNPLERPTVNDGTNSQPLSPLSLSLSGFAHLTYYLKRSSKRTATHFHDRNLVTSSISV